MQHRLRQLTETITPIKIAEWVGAFFGLAGAVMVGSNSPWTKYGLLAYLASNFCLIFFGLKHKAWGFLTMQLGFVAAGVFGVYRWFLAA